MNIIFVASGLISMYAGWSHFQGYGFHRICLLIFGLSLVLVSLFSHAPIDNSLSFSQQEDQLHSWFASSTGFSFTVLAIATGLIKKKDRAKISPLTIDIVATFLSILMFRVESFAGIWQRLIFIFSFGWMIYEFKTENAST